MKEIPFWTNSRYLQGESSSLCWLTKGKQLCKGIPSWTQLYCQIYINISTTCFGPYAHLQVGYVIRWKTIYNMVHYIHECGVSGGRDLVYKDMEGLYNYTNSWFICDVYIYVITDESWICVILQALHIFVNEILSPTYTTLMYVMYHIIYSF